MERKKESACRKVESRIGKKDEDLVEHNAGEGNDVIKVVVICRKSEF